MLKFIEKFREKLIIEYGYVELYDADEVSWLVLS